MGFYGNITNTSKTTFSFDRIYSNRLTMDANCNNDGIFIGRYVLVEYDKDATYPVIYTNGTEFFSDNTLEKRISYLGEKQKPEHESTIEAFYKNDIGQVQIPSQKDESGNELKYQVTFYRCIGGDENQNALFEEITTTSSNTPYTNNYAIDEKEYGDSYDSTVWVKASQTDEATGKRISKYVKIAELNSVVPTFNLIVDRPTSVPIAPHFDMDSTNVDYGMHIQPQWGFRIATADVNHSDQETQWIKHEYNSAEDKEDVFYASGINKDGTPIWTENEANLPAAIYYNQKAFEPKGIDGVITRRDENTRDSIHFSLGKSGNQYNIHNGKNKGYETSVQDDTQELTINLPSIGNMMSDAWDIIHGQQRNDSDIDSLQGRLNFFKDKIGPNEIPIRSSEASYLIGSKINGGQSYEATADTIETEAITTSFDTDDAWIYTKIDTKKVNEEGYNQNAIAIHHKWTGAGDSPQETNINNNGDTIELYIPKVDKAGHIVGTQNNTVTLPYGYKTIKVTNTEDTSVSNAAQTININGQSADNTQDTLTLSASNHWIKLDNNTEDTIKFGHQVNTIVVANKEDTDLNNKVENNIQNIINIPDWTYDEAGHITAKQNHEYTLPFGYKYIEVANDGSGEIAAPGSTTGTQTADSTQGSLKLDSSNKWIVLDKTNDNDVIKFGHLHSELSSGEHKLNAQEPKFGQAFNIQTFTTDNAGHLIDKGTETVTIPHSTIVDNVDKNIMTDLTLDETNGIFTIARENLGSLQLKDYTAISGTRPNQITANDTLQTALGKLETTIENLEYTDTDNISQFVSKVTQSDGKIAVGRANAGTLTLTGYQQGTETGDVNSGDTINSAFAKLQNQITHEENRINTILKGENDLTDTLDTFIELQKYIEDHGKEAADMATAINNEIDRAVAAEKQLKNDLDKEATTFKAAANLLAQQITTEKENAVQREQEIANNLQLETERAQQEEYTLNSRCNVLDKEVKNLINTSKETSLKVIAINDQLVEIDAEVASLIAGMETEIQTREQEVYTLNSRCNVLDKEVKQLINKVAELTVKIEALSNKE